MPLRFEEPIWLVLLVLWIPMVLLARRSLAGSTRARAMVAVSLRGVLIALLALALSHPYFVKRGEGLTTTVILDRSRSIPLDVKRRALELMRASAERKERPEDRLAVLTVGGDANLTALPDANSIVEVTAEPADLDATDLGAAVRLALAVMPDDTANRIVLVSDGNETTGNLMEAADAALANGVPIDVVPLTYAHANEVLFDQLVAPSRAREGQTGRLRMVLRSEQRTSGQLRLRLNDHVLDLNGDAEGDSRSITLEPGVNAIEQSIEFTQSGPHRFEAVFIPDDPAQDAIDANNAAMAVTFVGGQGKVLILDDGVVASEFLAGALRSAGITVDVVPPDGWRGGLVFLAAYDAVVLANLPRWVFDGDQDRMLHAYVHDLGGGLLMVGGEFSFGAGGWIDSEVAKVLPVELNPPQTRQMPAGALALIMHSCEMAQGNYWGQVVAQAAIEALSRLDYCGIVEFGWGAGGGQGIEGCVWAYPMQQVGDKTAAIRATKTMNVGDMPSFDPSMQLALMGLQNVPAAQRHAIIISDGDPSPPSAALLNQYVQAQVTVTTIMVGGHGTLTDQQAMRHTASKTGGRFYDVKNPRTLPQIFIKEAQIVSRSLIQDGSTWQPQVVQSLPGPTHGFDGLPTINGYVLTAARSGQAQTPFVIPTTDAMDPLLAFWNYGIGRSIAWTSDLSNRWGAAWAGWSRFEAFWEQAMRWVMRPSSPTDVQVTTRQEGNRAIVELEAFGPDASALNFLRTNAVVLRPDASSEPLVLSQTGSGRYRGEFEVEQAGAYLINVVHESAAGGERQTGSVQAAVTVPYPREFRNVRPDRALLKQVATRTGGRVIEATDPALIDLYDFAGLEVPRSPRAMWDLMAIIAAGLLLIDVAVRRLAIEVREVIAFVRALFGRRAVVGAETVDAWKRARSQVDHRRERAAAPDPAARYDASADRQASQFSVSQETTAPPGPIVAGLKPKDPSGQPPEGGQSTEDDEMTTSRLLAARRRLRGGEEEKPNG